MRRDRLAAETLARLFEQFSNLVFERFDGVAGFACSNLFLRGQVRP